MSHHNLDEREIVKLLRSASALEPTAAEHAAAVARVRASFSSGSAATFPMRLSRRRLILGAAAAVGALLLAIAMLLLATRPRTAWAELEAAAEASGQFRGWVSVRMNLPNAKPFMVFDTELLSRAQFWPPDDKGRSAVRFFDHRRSTDSYWSPAAGTVFVGELSPAELEMTYERYARHFNQAVDFREQLTNMREALGAGNLDVRSARDDGLDRFDIDWYFRDASGKRRPTPVDTTSYWVDPKTHLITKVRHARWGEKPSTTVYEYNHPIVTSIYDLGIPRDAKIVDRRPTGEVKDLLDQLDRRIAAGTGDGFAMIATVAAAQDAVAGGPVLDTLDVYAQSDHRWMWAQYLVGHAPGRDAMMNATQKPQLAAPPGWPDLIPAATITLVKDLKPNDLFAQLGDRSYRGGNAVIDEGDPASAQDAAYFGVPGLYWPGRFRLRVYSPWTAVSLHKNPDGTHTIVSEEMVPHATRRYKSHEVTLDPQSGLPLTAVDRVFDDAGIERRVERLTFHSNLRTPAGVWLPQKWTDEAFSSGGQLAYRKEAILRFDPAARVPDSWFDPPGKRFTANP